MENLPKDHREVFSLLQKHMANTVNGRCVVQCIGVAWLVGKVCSTGQMGKCGLRVDRLLGVYYIRNMNR